MHRPAWDLVSTLSSRAGEHFPLPEAESERHGPLRARTALARYIQNPPDLEPSL